MSNEDKILEILLKMTGDVAATKNSVDKLSSLMIKVLDRLRSLEQYRANQQGQHQGSHGVITAIISILGALLAAGAAYAAHFGGHAP